MRPEAPAWVGSVVSDALGVTQAGGSGLSTPTSRVRVVMPPRVKTYRLSNGDLLVVDALARQEIVIGQADMHGGNEDQERSRQEHIRRGFEAAVARVGGTAN